MRFMILVHADEDSEAGVMPSTELLTQMGAYNEQLVEAGVMLAGEGLHPSSEGVRVRFTAGKSSVIDGPFAETKELVAGFWIWQTGSLDEAIEWVKRCPNPMPGESEIEIRQVYEAEDFGAEFTAEAREQEEELRAELARQNAANSGPGRSMRVVVFHKSEPRTEDSIAPDEAILTEMGRFNEQLVKEGLMVAGEGLHPSRRGARVRFNGAQRTVISGPITDSKELIAGYWMWRVGSMEEAIEWVKRCPMPADVEVAELEVRPVFESADFGEALTPELEEQQERLRAKTAR